MGLKGITGNYQIQTGTLPNQQPAHVLAAMPQESQKEAWNGPQGVVSISMEGRKLLEESQIEPSAAMDVSGAPETVTAGTEKSPYDRLNDQMDSVQKKLADIGKNNTVGKRTDETDSEYAEAMEELRKLREDQARQYEEEAEEAKKRAMENSKRLGDLEKGNRDLVIMLESFKGMDEGKKAGHGNGRDRTESMEDSGRADSIMDISGQIRSEAAAKEEGMDAILNDIHQKAQDGFSKAGKIGKDIRKQMDEIRDFVADSANSMQEKEEAVSQFVSYADPLLRDMQDSRMVALQRMKIFKAVSLERLGTQNMTNAKRAQEEVQAYAHQAAVFDAFDAAYESRQRDKIDALKERIKELQGIEEAQKKSEEEENPLIPEDAIPNLSENV